MVFINLFLCMWASRKLFRKSCHASLYINANVSVDVDGEPSNIYHFLLFSQIYYCNLSNSSPLFKHSCFINFATVINKNNSNRMNPVVYFADNGKVYICYHFTLFILNRTIKPNLDPQVIISWSMLKFHTQKQNNLKFYKKHFFYNLFNKQMFMLLLKYLLTCSRVSMKHWDNGRVCCS